MKHSFYSVYRCADRQDCTNHGPSSQVSSALLFWDCDKSEAIEFCENHNLDPELQFIIVPRTLWGEDHSYAEPLVKPEGIFAQTFGGNFLYTSGSAFTFKGERTGRPIPIHDRFDDWDTFNSMCI